MRSFWTVREAAQKLHCSDQTVYNRIRNKKLRRVRGRRGIRIEPNEFEEDCCNKDLISVVDYCPPSIEEYSALIDENYALRKKLQRIRSILNE